MDPAPPIHEAHDAFVGSSGNSTLGGKGREGGREGGRKRVRRGRVQDRRLES